ncbi:MAG: single-stranded DNA-binding protein [Pseudomonadota bacterium]
MAQKSLNKVMLIGNLGKDPEVRYTGSGRAMATFTVATSVQWKDQDGRDQERTEWHRIVAWGPLGEVCGKYLGKGNRVYVEGRIQSREWEDNDGNKRTTFEIVANDMIMLGGQSQGRGSDDYEDRKPPSRQPPRQAPRGEPSPKQDDRPAYQPPPPEDDIPF